MKATTIAELPGLAGNQVEITGWLTGLRSNGKIAFLQLRDGTGFVQGILVRSNVADGTWELARSLTQESSVRVTGLVREDDRSTFGFEIELSGVELIHAAVDYPIT